MIPCFFVPKSLRKKTRGPPKMRASATRRLSLESWTVSSMCAWRSASSSCSPGLREGVAGGDHQHDLHLGERVLDEPLAAHVVLHEHNVGVVLLEAILHPAQELDLHLDVRRDAVVGHHAQGPHERLHREDAVDHDLDARLPVLAEARRERLDAARARQEPPALLEDGAARVREHRPVPLPVEDADPEPLLELVHGVAHGRLHLVQRLRGGGEAPVLVDGLQGLQGIERDAHAPIIEFFDGVGRIIAFSRRRGGAYTNERGRFRP